MRVYIGKKGFIYVVLAALILVGSIAQASEAISPAELADRISSGEPPVVLDVRSTGEFSNGHIPGALNIPHRQLRDRIGELLAVRNMEIVVHCEAGPRADYALSVLSEAEFTRLRELKGHMRSWRAGGFPVE